MCRYLSISFLILILFSSLTFAHSGRTDSQGGHRNRKTGEYHFHTKPSSPTRDFRSPKSESTRGNVNAVGSIVGAVVRNGPGVGYTKLWSPRPYTPFEVLAIYKDWYAVRDAEGDVGWIQKIGVTKSKAAIIISKYLNVRNAPNSNARILFQAPKNYTFKVIETKGEWYKVEDQAGDKGWIEKAGAWDGSTPVEK